MLSTSRWRPGFLPRPPAWLVPVLVALSVAAAHPCRALEVRVDAPREQGGLVWVDLDLGGLFSPRVEESLSRGMPATLEVHAELWRRRSAWFDRLENSFDGSIKIRYEVWSRRYRIERQGQPELSAGTLDSIRTILSRPIAVPVGRVGQLKPDARYFVMVSATLKPLAVEDIEEGEGWLSGEVENKRRSGFGFITAIPRSVFDAVRNFAGFGDERARAMTGDFELADLFAPAR